MILVDLHDGADGRPVVKHAFTFIKDAYLGEILIQIKEFSFCASPYVLIFLSSIFIELFHSGIHYFLILKIIVQINNKLLSHDYLSMSSAVRLKSISFPHFD
jgi:hypothetical protein